MTKFYFHETDKGYIYDKRIFWIIIILGLLVVGGTGYAQGFKYNFYFKCIGVKNCENPFVEGGYSNSVTGYKYECLEDWCSKLTLPPGEYGQKPNALNKYFVLIIILLVALGLGLNHIIHNKGKGFDIKLNLPPKIMGRLKKISSKFELEEDIGGENEKEDDNNNGINRSG